MIKPYVVAAVRKAAFMFAHRGHRELADAYRGSVWRQVLANRLRVIRRGREGRRQLRLAVRWTRRQFGPLGDRLRPIFEMQGHRVKETQVQDLIRRGEAMGLKSTLEQLRPALSMLRRLASTPHEVSVAEVSSARLEEALASHARLVADSPNPLKIARWVSSGELERASDVQGVYDSAGRALDASCAWEILGTVLFQGEDGKYYTVTTEAVLGEASEQFVRETLEEEGEES